MQLTSKTQRLNLHCESKKCHSTPGITYAKLLTVTDFKNSFTVAFYNKFAARLLLYFEPHLKHVLKTTLRIFYCRIFGKRNLIRLFVDVGVTGTYCYDVLLTE